MGANPASRFRRSCGVRRKGAAAWGTRSALRLIRLAGQYILEISSRGSCIKSRRNSYSYIIHHRMGKAIAAIVVVLVVVGGIYYYFSQQAQAPSSQTPTPTPTPAATPSGTPPPAGSTPTPAAARTVPVS